MSYLNKFKGQSASVSPSPPMGQVAFIWLGAFLAAASVGFLAYATGQPLVLGSFGASMYLHISQSEMCPKDLMPTEQLLKNFFATCRT